MVTINKDPRLELNTWHQTGPFAITTRCEIKQRGVKNLELHNESVLKIQDLLTECKTANQRFRAYGSLWSLNDIAFNGGWVLNNSDMDVINSRIIRDDAIFNAAIVSLGSFGFIAAIVMEVENIYSLKRYVRNINYDDAIQLLENLDFKNSNFKITEETDGDNNPIQPYHFKTYINQYTKDCVAEVIYKIPYQKTQYPEVEIGTQLHPDLFRLMKWALEKSDMKVTKLLTRLIQGDAMPNPKGNPKPLIGTLGDIFHAVDFQQPAFSLALGVNQKQLNKAMQTWLKIFKAHKAPGLSAIKLVKQTKATIGFHKFPITAVIHMDGVQWDPKEDQLLVQQEIIKTFIKDGIDFTLHWGKNGAWDHPSLAELMYSSKKEDWIKQRNRLLRPEMAKMFSNDFLKRLGMDTIIDR